jgi:ketosteroid isomerase-like protein
MSQENVEIVRRMYDAYYAGDADGALAYFTPDVVSDHSNRLGGGVAHGRDGPRRQITEWVGTFEGYREEVDEIRDLGDSVCVVASQRGRGKGSGVEVEITYALLYEFEGNQIARLTAYLTLGEALEAAGLSE